MSKINQKLTKNITTNSYYYVIYDESIVSATKLFSSIFSHFFQVNQLIDIHKKWLSLLGYLIDWTDSNINCWQSSSTGMKILYEREVE